MIAHAGDLFALYVGAIEFELGLGLASPTGEDLAPEEIVGMLHDYILSLPEERYRTPAAPSTRC